MNNYKKLIPRVSAHLTVLFDKFWSIPIKTHDPSTKYIIRLFTFY